MKQPPNRESKLSADELAALDEGIRSAMEAQSLTWEEIKQIARKRCQMGEPIQGSSPDRLL